MQHRFVWMVCSLAILTGGCAKNNPSASSSPNTMDRVSPKSAEQATQGAAIAPAGQSTVDDSPIPPKDAQWTILCESITGPNHLALSKRRKAELIAATGMSDWYVIHAEDQSTLYYGYYRTFNDPKDAAEGRRAQSDRLKLNGVTDAMGDRPFRSCIFVEIDSPDPNAPRQWDLSRLRLDETDERHYWSLQIAAYKDTPERKKAAVDAVKSARDAGYEAYYFHGETTSSVCIGLWPKPSVEERDPAVMQNPNDNDALLVLPPALLPDPGKELHAADGQRLKPVAPKFVAVDPTLLAMLREFPTHAVNGFEIEHVVRGNPVKDRSFMIVVPVRKGASVFDDPGSDEGAPTGVPGVPGMTPAEPTARQPNAPAPARTRLRSLDR